ncbi:MAG: hypothetical protein ACYDAE_05185 [Steroidobacteraceae bacterium]
MLRVSWRRHPERIAAAAAALLLQAAVYLALNPRGSSPTGATNGPTLAAMILAAARPKREAPPPLHPTEHLTAIPVARSLMQPIAPSEPHTPVSRIDWDSGIQREVRAELSHKHAPRRLRFGFPQMPTEEGPPPEFGWNDNRLNRIQRLAHGIIDLSDNCFIRLWPPIPWCHFEPANGDLFKHMHDPRPPERPNTLP